jgi:hypothetical protein
LPRNIAESLVEGEIPPLGFFTSFDVSRHGIFAVEKEQLQDVVLQ